MSIYRSTNPLDFNAVDGIVIDEVTPAPSVQGVGTGVAILVGQFERGPSTLNEPGGIANIQGQYGKNAAFPGYQAIRNKKFSRLRIIRVIAAGSAQASYAALATATLIATFSAKGGNGAYGNGITVKIEAGSSTGRKYTITDTNASAVYAQEIYDNVLIAGLAAAMAGSNLVNVVVASTASDPDTIAATPLAGGLDGTAVDADYQTAIDKAGVEGAGNVLFLDAYTATRNTALKNHTAANPDKMVIVCGPQVESVAAAITNAAGLKDSDGRIIYAYPWAQTALDGVLVYQPGGSWYASVLSQSSPAVDPASAENLSFMQGITDLQLHLVRSDYIQLMAAGISAFEIDSDLGGIKIKSGIVTQTANSSKILVSRRRMTDYLTTSAGKFLKLYQNVLNTRKNRDAVKAAILNFVGQNELIGVLPRDSEVKSGKAKLVDTESMNTDATIAAGFFFIIWRQRIFSSNRFIVLQAEVGQSVVVTDQS